MANTPQTQAAAYFASEYAKMLRDNVGEIEPHYRTSANGGTSGR